MRNASRRRPWIAGSLLARALPIIVVAGTIEAGPPTDLSVTVYRGPSSADRVLDLDDLRGFALITEHRSVSLPAGDSVIRFPGVADGIRSSTVVLTGMPGQLLELDRDARVLGPLELIQAAVGRAVTLIRTNPTTGAETRVPATIRSGDQGAVVFETTQGIEALHCSALDEHLSFSAVTDLGATPTLSVRIRTPAPVTTTATLSYLSTGFDWQASYVATLSVDTATMSIGGWVTLANSNGAGFPGSHAQIVAGKLNRVPDDNDAAEAQADEQEVIAQCWPSDTTSTPGPVAPQQAGAKDDSLQEMVVVSAAKRMAFAPAAMAAPAMLVQQEQLGDLKLYRVPETTDIASHQIKQVRLLDRQAVPVETLYRADVTANSTVPLRPARKLLRTQNDDQHHLGLALPAGRIITTTFRHGDPLMLSESPLQDLARGEKLEIDLGDSPDVGLQAEHQHTHIAASRTQVLPLLPGVEHLRSAVLDDAASVEFSNARAQAVTVELHLHLPDGTQLIGAQPAPATAGAEPLFRVVLAANARSSVRYQTEHRSSAYVRP